MRARARDREFDQVLRRIGIPRAGGYSFYFREYVFRDLELAGRTMVDVGGGNGLASFWAIKQANLSHAVVVDPLLEGSNARMRDQFAEFERMSGRPPRLTFIQEEHTILSEQSQTYDVVCLHNSINHLSEQDVCLVGSDASADNFFVSALSDVARALSPDGVMVVADCTNRNLFGDIGVKSPLSPHIEWHLHQPPEVWVTLLARAGLSVERVIWTTRREFGVTGQWLLGNRWGSYLTSSHFVLHCRRS